MCVRFFDRIKLVGRTTDHFKIITLSKLYLNIWISLCNNMYFRNYVTDLILTCRIGQSFSLSLHCKYIFKSFSPETSLFFLLDCRNSATASRLNCSSVEFSADTVFLIWSWTKQFVQFTLCVAKVYLLSFSKLTVGPSLNDLKLAFAESRLNCYHFERPPASCERKCILQCRQYFS